MTFAKVTKYPTMPWRATNVKRIQLIAALLVLTLSGYTYAQAPVSEPSITATTSTNEPTTETYLLDPNHTYVLWRVSHFGFSTPSGKWHVTGNLTINEKKPEEGKLEVNVDMAGLETGLSKFDQHLKSEEFLNIEKYPTAKFVSDKITVTGKDTAKVQGMLTLHGVTKPIVLDVKLNKVGINPVNNKKTAGFSATAAFNRSDFDIKAFLPGVGDRVELIIEAEATKQ